MKAKSPDDVRGFKIQCVNYIKCPLCYGCRNYNAIDPECKECMKDKKLNICNTHLHRPEAISKMILKSEIKMPSDTKFKSNSGGNKE